MEEGKKNIQQIYVRKIRKIHGQKKVGRNGKRKRIEELRKKT